MTFIVNKTLLINHGKNCFTIRVNNIHVFRNEIFTMVKQTPNSVHLCQFIRIPGNWNLVISRRRQRLAIEWVPTRFTRRFKINRIWIKISLIKSSRTQMPTVTAIFWQSSLHVLNHQLNMLKKNLLYMIQSVLAVSEIICLTFRFRGAQG